MCDFSEMNHKINGDIAIGNCVMAGEAYTFAVDVLNLFRGKGTGA